MGIADAAEALAGYGDLAGRLRAAVDLGLGHLRLGESSEGLSPGERARLELAGALSRGPSGVPLVVGREVEGLFGEDLATVLAALERFARAGGRVRLLDPRGLVEGKGAAA
jgi:excinuclease ABC subunit A